MLFRGTYKITTKYIFFIISGTELTKANLHTADGISVRFPRVTRIRDDKDWETATNLDELKHLYKTSKEKTDVSLLNKLAAASESDEPPVKKVKLSPAKPSVTNKIDSYLVKDISPKHRKSTVKMEMNSTASSTDELDSKEDLEISFPKNPLPDVFKDKKLGFYPDFITFSEDDRFHFERHWIAYGGIVVKSVRSTDVDYMVHHKKTIPMKKVQKLKRLLKDNVAHVNKYWLEKSINEKELCDTKQYKVVIEP
jgi:DNA ligase 3